MGQTSYNNNSDLFRKDRLFDIDRFPDRDRQDAFAHPIWDENERPPDPMAWRVRQVLERIPENHARLLEDIYFLDKDIAEIAKERAVTRQSVYGMLKRAIRNFKKAMAEARDELADVPAEEL